MTSVSAEAAAPGYAPLPLDASKNHAVALRGACASFRQVQGLDDLPPDWKPLKEVEIK